MVVTFVVCLLVVQIGLIVFSLQPAHLQSLEGETVRVWRITVPGDPHAEGILNRTTIPFYDSNSLLNLQNLQRKYNCNTSTVHENPYFGASTLSEKNWKNGTFCYDFLENTFQMPAPVCADSPQPLSVECLGNSHSRSMGTCTLRNVMIIPQLLSRAMSDPDRPKFVSSEQAMVLLKEAGSSCVNMTTDNIMTRVEGGDYILKVINHLRHEQLNTSMCTLWINETSFFFTAHRFHIYFRFLDYYNVHKLLKSSLSCHPYLVRISGSDNYHFPEFDQALFPEAKTLTLEDLMAENAKICFKEVVLVPKSYASPLFQCKNRVGLRSKCMDCDGSGLVGAEVNLFSKRVVEACTGKIPPKNGSLIVLISRTPYLRSQRDDLTKFERVLDNEEELALAIRKSFNNSVVRIVHLENLTICEQIAYGHNADILLGVHGSGLVHLWWMKSKSLVYEMEPHYEVSNPTFRMLSRLTGHNYHSEYIGGGWKTVHADVQGIVDHLHKYSYL